MYTFDQAKRWQNHSNGVEKLLNTHYKKDMNFKEAVDWLVQSDLSPKDIKRVADIASLLKDDWAYLRHVYVKNGGKL